MTDILGPQVVSCTAPDCPVRAAVACAVVDGDAVVGALYRLQQGDLGDARVGHRRAGPVGFGPGRAAAPGRQRTRLIEAQLRALRAQIAPHFIYNALTAIASSVRTDPDRARDLLLEFADFTRYSFRHGGEFTTLADELGNIERYLALEQARFGDRLVVSLAWRLRCCRRRALPGDAAPRRECRPARY